jgi:hypothetical protein
MGLSSPTQGVWFPQWAEVLARVRLKDLERRAYRSAIMEYLGFCKRSRQRATVDSARKFMEQVEARHRLPSVRIANALFSTRSHFIQFFSGVAVP